MRIFIVIATAILEFFSVAQAQVINPVTWRFSSHISGNSEAEIVFTASILKGWHMYGINIPDGGPVPTSFTFNSSKDFSLDGKVQMVTKPVVQTDPAFHLRVEIFSSQAQFSQKIKLLKKGTVAVSGTVEFMCCNDHACIPPNQEDFNIVVSGNDSSSLTGIPQAPVTLGSSLTKNVSDSISAKEDRKESGQVSVSVQDVTPKGKQSGSLWAFFLISFLAGLGGVLTPCVYPMIPMTVSFFMRGQEKRRRAILNSLFFGFSIILIYTLIGVLVSLTKAGADAANQVSTHWLPNAIFFLLFVIFAASFFGMFEIMLPSSLGNKADRNADQGGLAGAFFMALTTVIISFSCTGPIVGGLLVEAAGGLALKPILGMFGFSLAFALPFTLFAMFPSLLENLPKSGGWLNSVKVVLGFIMLAFSLKFLSNINETYHLGILGRGIYLSLWIVIFSLMGFYLLGKIRFAHDSDVPYVGFFRLLLVIAIFAFVVYLIPGLFGAPLKSMGALIPPASDHSFSLTSPVTQGTVGGQPNTSEPLCDMPKYNDILELPYGLAGYFDYDQGLACAQKRNMPVFLDFKGHTCSNCKKMESEVWSDPQVLNRLREKFIIISLYVDDHTKLPENEWITSSFDGQVKKTMGKKNADIQIRMFHTNTLPLYAIVDSEGNSLTDPVGAGFNIPRFIMFLDRGLQAFQEETKQGR